MWTYLYVHFVSLNSFIHTLLHSSSFIRLLCIPYFFYHTVSHSLNSSTHMCVLLHNVCAFSNNSSTNFWKKEYVMYIWGFLPVITTGLSIFHVIHFIIHLLSKGTSNNIFVFFPLTNCLGGNNTVYLLPFYVSLIPFTIYSNEISIFLLTFYIPHIVLFTCTTLLLLPVCFSDST